MRLAKKSGATPGDVIRYDPAPEPMVATIAIGVLAVVEGAFIGLFLGSMLGRGLVIVFALTTVLLVLIGLAALAKRAAGPMVGALLLALWTAPALAGCLTIDPYCATVDPEEEYIKAHLKSGETLDGLSSERRLDLLGERTAAIGDAKQAVPTQQAQAAWLGGALFTLAAILSLYRKFFLPDVMIVKKRKLKYEDLM